MGEIALDTISLENKLLQNNDIEFSQNNFLETTFGKVINSAIDIGIKAVLPDLIEDEIINIKDSIMVNGFKDGLKEAINSAINTGKSAMGIVTGEFENISQIEIAVKKGALLDKTSKILDLAINLASNKNLINKEISSMLKTGKNTIINTVSNNIEKTLTNQIKSIERIEKYCENWNEAYINKDFSKMENALKNIKNNLEKIVPLENVINKARTIETLHQIIKNTGNYNLSNETFELAEKIG